VRGIPDRRGAAAYRDVDLERIFLWQLNRAKASGCHRKSSADARDGFLLDDMEASLCWIRWKAARGIWLGPAERPGAENRAAGAGSDAAGIRDQEFPERGIRSGRAPGGAAVPGESPAGARGFVNADLEWFERIARHVSSSIESVFLLRHLRARAIEAERSRISRDLHDGILQTLLSIEIQIDVLRRKATTQPDQVESGLASLQQTVKNEGGELRHMVTDLRPLRVQSADMVDLMRGSRRGSGTSRDWRWIY